MIAGTDRSVILLYTLTVVFVLTPRAMVAGMIIRSLPKNNIVDQHKRARRFAKIGVWVRLITLIPSLIFDILELNEEIDENEEEDDDRRRSKGGIITIGILFMIASVIFTLYFTYVLYMYFKKGPDPEYGPEQRPEDQQDQRDEPDNEEPVPHQEQVEEEMTPKSGDYRIDDNVLEGKFPNAAAKDMAEIHMSINGGIDDNDPIDYNPNLDVENGPNIDDTPDDIDIPKNDNKVVERPNYNGSDEKVPPGHFM